MRRVWFTCCDRILLNEDEDSNGNQILEEYLVEELQGCSQRCDCGWWINEGDLYGRRTRGIREIKSGRKRYTVLEDLEGYIVCLGCAKEYFNSWA